MPPYLKVRRDGRIVSVVVVIAVGANTDGRREVLDMEVGTSEAEPSIAIGLAAAIHSGTECSVGEHFAVPAQSMPCNLFRPHVHPRL